MRGGFSGRESHFGTWGFRDTNAGRCSGGKGANRRGTGEQGEGRESTRWDGRGAGLHHGNHQGLWRRGRSRNQVYRDVGSGTQRAASVAVGAVGMGVGDLHGAGDNHQKMQTSARRMLHGRWAPALWSLNRILRHYTAEYGTHAREDQTQTGYSPASTRGVIRPMLST